MYRTEQGPPPPRRLPMPATPAARPAPARNACRRRNCPWPAVPPPPSRPRRCRPRAPTLPRPRRAHSPLPAAVAKRNRSIPPQRSACDSPSTLPSAGVAAARSCCSNRASKRRPTARNVMLLSTTLPRAATYCRQTPALLVPGRTRRSQRELPLAASTARGRRQRAVLLCARRASASSVLLLRGLIRAKRRPSACAAPLTLRRGSYVLELQTHRQQPAARRAAGVIPIPVRLSRLAPPAPPKHSFANQSRTASASSVRPGTPAARSTRRRIQVREESPPPSDWSRARGSACCSTIPQRPGCRRRVTAAAADRIAQRTDGHPLFQIRSTAPPWPSRPRQRHAREQVWVGPSCRLP
jgi:hypothetical protein